MALLVAFVTANDAVIRTVVERRVALVPFDLRSDRFAALGGEEVLISAYQVDRTSTHETLIGHLVDLDLKHASGVLLLTDDSLPDLIGAFGDIFSVNRFAVPGHGQNVSNLLSAIVTKALRAFRHYKTRFDDRKYQQILRLPLRNFEAEEIGAMRATCRDKLNRANFGRELDGVLETVRRQRQHPKKASSYPTTYLVDDHNKHFSLGHEVHARAETACPPHDIRCVLANGFRFGRAFDGERHYNVSRDRGGMMDGMYPDCHEVSRSGKSATHLNMFTSDFF